MYVLNVITNMENILQRRNNLFQKHHVTFKQTIHQLSSPRESMTEITAFSNDDVNLLKK